MEGVQSEGLMSPSTKEWFKKLDTLNQASPAPTGLDPSMYQIKNPRLLSICLPVLAIVIGLFFFSSYLYIEVWHDAPTCRIHGPWRGGVVSTA